MNLLQSFEHLSSSTLPTICTMANLISFTYSRKLETNVQDVIPRCHILVKGLVSKGGAIHVALDFILSLNMPC